MQFSHSNIPSCPEYMPNAHDSAPCYFVVLTALRSSSHQPSAHQANRACTCRWTDTRQRHRQQNSHRLQRSQLLFRTQRRMDPWLPLDRSHKEGHLATCSTITHKNKELLPANLLITTGRLLPICRLIPIGRLTPIGRLPSNSRLLPISRQLPVPKAPLVSRLLLTRKLPQLGLLVSTHPGLSSMPLHASKTSTALASSPPCRPRACRA